MLEKRESYRNRGSVGCVRSAIFTLVLAASAVGCNHGENLHSRKLDAGVVEVKPDSGLEKLIIRIRKAVKKSQRKEGNEDEERFGHE